MTDQPGWNKDLESVLNELNALDGDNAGNNLLMANMRLLALGGFHTLSTHVVSGPELPDGTSPMGVMLFLGRVDEAGKWAHVCFGSNTAITASQAAIEFLYEQAPCTGCGQPMIFISDYLMHGDPEAYGVTEGACVVKVMGSVWVPKCQRNNLQGYLTGLGIPMGAVFPGGQGSQN